jgi:hypothetical protein
MEKIDENRAAIPKRKVGRPEVYTQDLADKICAELSLGKSLRSVARQDWCPDTVTIFKWFRTHPEFLTQYTLAKEESADLVFDDVSDITDQEPERDDNGKIDPAWVNLQRLKVDARKWVASKLKPKKYGERVEHTGEGQSITLNLVSGVPEPKTIEASVERP